MSLNTPSQFGSRLGGFIHPDRSRFIFIAFFFLLGMAATYFFWHYTPFGVGTGHDSLFYFSAAKNFASGRGLFWTGSGGELKPLTHFPPFYSLILAGVSQIGFPISLSARSIAALLFGLNIALFGLVLYTFTQRMFISVLGAIFLMVSPIMVETHLKAMSEPVFFFVSFASLATLTLYINQPRRSFFILAILFSALAYLSRYSGAAVLLACFLSLLTLSKRSFKVKIRDAFVFIGLASLPMLLWMVRNMLLTGSTTNREINIHLINSDAMRQFLDVIFYWFSPKLHSHWLEVALLSLVFIISTAFAWREIRRRCEADCRAPYLAIILLIFSVVYVVFLMVSLSFFDASTRISNRILSPLFLAFVLVVMLTMSYSTRRVGQLIIPVALLALLFIGSLPYMIQQTNQMLTTIQRSGSGFTSRAWRSSSSIRWISDSDSEPVIITNQAMAVNFLTDIPAYQIPERFDPVKSEERPGYDLEIERLSILLQEPNSFLVLFNRTDFSSPSSTELMESLQLVFKAADGSVYRNPDNVEPLTSP